MKIVHVALFPLLFCVACTQSEEVMDTTAIEKDGVKFHEVGYGKGYAENTKVIYDSADPTGRTRQARSFIITDKTDTIPAKIGVEFGVNFTVEATKSDDVELTKVWVFPTEMVNPVTHKHDSS